ncbi:MAG: S-methyl-5-thioribose-1-phosphate isomerase [Bacteroidales bacterium]
MNVDGIPYTSIWTKKTDTKTRVYILDQQKLPFETSILELSSSADAYKAIREMQVRGAPLIGVTAAYGLYLAALESHGSSSAIQKQAEKLNTARPTAVNLRYGIQFVLRQICESDTDENRITKTLLAAEKLRTEEIQRSQSIGKFGLPLIHDLWKKKKSTVNILTHCNAGWLACVDYGTATAPMYMAYDEGIPIHVYVDETRPRNQGARLTAWELGHHGIDHTVIPDNTGGLLMQKGLIDAVIVGSDRTSIKGDVVNKIGTYLKALAAKENNIPFYVALPVSSIDFDMTDVFRETTIEQRQEHEVRTISGWYRNREVSIQLVPEKSKVANYGFDITPARFVSRLITDKGLIQAEQKAIELLYKEKNE